MSDEYEAVLIYGVEYDSDLKPKFYAVLRVF